MVNDAKFTPGMPVWVIERDEDGNADAISGYIFLAQVEGVVILSAHIEDYDLGGILEYHIQCTVEDYDTNLSVFPDEDCYVRKEDCEADFKMEQDGYEYLFAERLS